MKNLILDDLLYEEEISRRIFTQLSYRELKICSQVNKLWLWAARDAMSVKTIKLTVEQINKLNRKKQDLQKYLINNYKYATELDIIGWSKNGYIPCDRYDLLLKNCKVNVKSLTLRGRGKWTTCCCPSEENNCGSLIGSHINHEQLTNLEYLHIGQTFEISSCALIDLISRSPNLKVLKFGGLIVNCDHAEKFMSKLFYSDLETIYWPWALKKHLPTLKTIIKRNDNITTFYSNGETTFDLLGADIFPNLKHLSLNLNESWVCKPNHLKRAYRLVDKTKYLGLAKKLEALELRTFEFVKLEEPEDQENEEALAIRETNLKIDRLYEQYKVDFWSNIGLLRNLKYLAVYGSWEFDSVCCDISRNLLPIEYLKIHLLQNSILSALEAGEENLTLSIATGLKSLRKLVNLRSIQYTCYEKLNEIDLYTVNALKEVYDKIWALDIKTTYTNEVEEFLINLARRGNQLGKTYKLLISVQAKDDDKNSRFVLEQNLKPSGTILKEKLFELANNESVKRYGEGCANIYLWGLEQAANTRDTMTYKKLKSDWSFYENIFNLNSTFY